MAESESPAPEMTPEEAYASDAGEFRDQLVRGSDQWWEFLDGPADTKPPAETETEDIDRSQATSSAQVGPRPSSRAYQCRHCESHNPADATFCFFCGAQPTERLGYQQILVVIDDVPDPRLRARVASILSQADRPMSNDEIKKLLSEPPAYLFLDGPPGQIEATLERLGDLGLQARGTTVEATGLGWYGELAESMGRHAQWLTAAGGVIAATLLLWWLWSVWAVVLGGGGFAWLMVEHARWYRTHYRLRADAVLEQLAGFQPSDADRARQLLAGLHDDDVRKSLTACLMEYYAVWHLINASEALNGPVSRRLRSRLSDFLQHLLDACENFDRIHRFLHRNYADSASNKGNSRPDISDKRLSNLEDQLTHCRRQLVELASSIESLRAKLLSIDVDTGDERTDLRLQGLLSDLDTEAEVLEETLEELAHTYA